MASTYSPLKIELIGTGEQAGTWGSTTNTNLGTAIEQAIGGKADITLSSTSTTLTLTDTNALQDARALYLNLTGTPGGAATLNVPGVEKAYIVKNGTTGGFAVTVKVTGQTGVSVPNGATMHLYNNGTDVVNALTNLPLGATIDGSPIGTGAGSVTSVAVSGGTTGITTSGGPITTSGTITLGGTLAVANGGTGATNSTTARTNLGLGSVATLNSVSLTSNVTGTLPIANGGTGTTSTQFTNLTTNVTGTLPAANGGTAQSTYTTGDLLYASATNTLAKRAIGTTGQILTVSGGVPTWTTPAAGGSVTSVDVSGGTTGLTTSGGPITTSGTITIGGTLAVANGGTGATDAGTARTNLGLGSLATLNTVGTSQIDNASVTAAKLSGAQAGIAPIYGARVWGKFTVSVGSISLSGQNVSSMVKLATGKFEIYFSTNLPSPSGYSLVSSLGNSGGEGGILYPNLLAIDKVTVWTIGLDGLFKDWSINSFAIFN